MIGITTQSVLCAVSVKYKVFVKIYPISRIIGVVLGFGFKLPPIICYFFPYFYLFGGKKPLPRALDG